MPRSVVVGEDLHLALSTGSHGAVGPFTPPEGLVADQDRYGPPCELDLSSRGTASAIAFRVHTVSQGGSSSRSSLSLTRQVTRSTDGRLLSAAGTSQGASMRLPMPR